MYLEGEGALESVFAPRKGALRLEVGRVQSRRPFLKWAGGKRWLVEQHPQVFPARYETYIEPFLGSGAVFFFLGPKRALLADRNAALVETFQAVRDDWRGVEKELRRHKRAHSADYYYKMREVRPRTARGRAAQFVYLNRTCWNGLYRVNRNGQFNVPKGDRDDVLLGGDDFSGVSALLQDAKLDCADFRLTIEKARKGDLLFVDPPYVTKKRNGFDRYNNTLFGWGDQLALHTCLLAAKARGVKIVSTNANSKVLANLYRKDFQVSQLTRSSRIAGAIAARGARTELLIAANL